MKIADVLAQKPKDTITLWTHQTLPDVMCRFEERRISSVGIVDPEGRPLGLVTDRDALHAIAQHGAQALALPVTQVMRSPPPYCTAEMTVSQAMRRMSNDRLRHLVVMGEEEMLGVVSIGDLVKVRLDDVEVEGRVLREMALGHIAGRPFGSLPHPI